MLSFPIKNLDSDILKGFTRRINMKKENLKKELNKYSKEEIINALLSSFMSEYTLQDILTKARDTKFNRLMDESKKVSEEIFNIRIEKEYTLKKKVELLKKREKYQKKYDKLQRQIDKLLKIN